MHVDLVFTGLCSFLNVDKTNATMGDPGVIAVQTPTMAGMPPDTHVAFIAYDTTQTDVADSTGFQPVTKAPECNYLVLTDSVEISITGHAAADPTDPTSHPTLQQNYLDWLLRKDDYWPEAKDQWDRNYVPTAGSKPMAGDVKFYMRFGTGILSAGRISQVTWHFPRHGSAYFEGTFAEEVVYGFPLVLIPSEIVVELRHLGDADSTPAFETLHFSPKQAGGMVTLFIGNNATADIGNAVRRTVTTNVTNPSGDHFKYLNAIAGKIPGQGDGPIPTGINSLPGGGGGGGENGGPCGPMSGDN